MRLKPYTLENISILDAASDGRCVARYDGRVIFVEGGVPGDVVDLYVYNRERKNHVARISRLVHPAAARVEPVCAHFGVCGGCKWQHMAYDSQLQLKQKQVEDALTRIGGLELPEIRPILGSPQTYYYRNKLEFTFSNRRWMTDQEIASGKTFDAWGQQVAGFHVPRFFDKVVDIERCHLQDERINAVRNALRDFARDAGISFYDFREQTGFLRTMIFRTTEQEMMVILCVGEDDPARVDRIFSHLAERFPFVTSWIWIYNPRKNDSYSDLPWQVWKGTAYLTERLGSCQFRISPVAFFQTNTRQARVLYDVVEAFLEQSSEHIYDLYCGAGTIGIYVAHKAQRITGVEYLGQAVEDARVNAQLNQLNHLTFHAGDLARLLSPDWIRQQGQPDTVITDPPRAGMDRKVVAALQRMAPRSMVYVSCNPATQARDLALLAEDYHIMAVQPVDMFPQTTHVENVVLLERKALAFSQSQSQTSS